MTCLGRNAAERSYASPKVRDGDRECQAVSAQEQPRGATPCPRSGAAAGRSYPPPEARGISGEEQPHVQGAVAAQAQEGLEDCSTFKVRRGGGEEIPLIQGKEQRLHFAGAAVKRYPTSKVRETQVRW